MELKTYDYKTNKKAFIMTKALSEAYKINGKKFFDVWDDDIQWIERKISYYNNLIKKSEDDKVLKHHT